MRIAATVILGSMLLASSLRAAPEEVKEARRRYELGMAAYTLEHYDDAIKEFEAGFLLKPDPTFLYNIGQAYRLSDRPRQALNYYRKYLAMQPDARNRGEVEERIRSISDMLASSNRPPQNVVPPTSSTTGTTTTNTSPEDGASKRNPVPSVALTEDTLRKGAPGKRTALWVGVGVAAALVVGGVAVGVGVGVGASGSPVDPMPTFGTFKVN